VEEGTLQFLAAAVTLAISAAHERLLLLPAPHHRSTSNSRRLLGSSSKALALVWMKLKMLWLGSCLRQVD